MADNTTLDPGVGGDTIATDDVGGVKYQRVKLDGGGDGLTEPLPGTTADGLLVNLGANNDVTVSGVSTAAKQDTGNTSLASIDGKITAVNTGAVVVASSALPTGASTAARQDTGNTSLATIAGAVSGTEMQVDVLTMPTVTVQATNLDIRDLTSASDSVAVVGTVADDATTPGAPVMVGGMAKSPDGTDPGSVSAENDVARSITDLNRRIFVNHNHPRTLRKHLDGTTAYTDESIVADPGDGFQVVITNIIASTGAATALNFFLEEGSTKIFGPIYLEAVAGRGFASGPIYLPVTASTAVTLTSSASIAQSFDIEYFIQAV